jgi:hypothetical protein
VKSNRGVWTGEATVLCLLASLVGRQYFVVHYRPWVAVTRPKSNLWLAALGSCPVIRLKLNLWLAAPGLSMRPSV